MKMRTHQVSRPPAQGRSSREETPAAWLDELAAALHMPFERAEAIREELGEHLRERIRDLELEGLNESAAASAAVRELGSAAAVARRFRMAEQTPIRRRLMNLAVIGIAGAALVTSVVAINGGGQPENAGRAMVYQSELQTDARPTVAVKPMNVEKGKLGDILTTLGAAAAERTVVRWTALNESGMDGGDVLNFDAPLGDLASTVEAINEARGVNVNDVGALDYRVKDGVIEFAPRGLFDRRETVLVCYDIGDLIDGGIELEELCGVITSFVDPDSWVDNGGELGSMKIVGRRMFVKAPLRMQDGVKWFIEQLAKDGQASTRIDAELHGVVQAYHLKHAAANEVLRAIMTNQQIRAIDFSSFVVDEQTNSIMGRASKPEHRIIEDAIEALDVEQKPAATAVQADTSSLVYVSGLVARPGPYAHPGSELTLRRVLIVASIKPDATEATVVRGPVDCPETVGAIRGADLFDPTGLDFVIKPGDMVTVK